MKDLYISTKAKKDIKLYRNNKELMGELWDVIYKLRIGEELPASFRKHKLTGQYKNCLECHVRGDSLLIWIEDERINVLRFGSHSELFGK